jgi:hypothetical protein
MTLKVFVVVSKYEQNDEALRQAITTQFPNDFYDIGRGQWLIAFSGTAPELSVRLGIINPDKTSLINGTAVFGIAGYYGVSSRDMWEWLATKLANGPNPGGQIG